MRTLTLLLALLSLPVPADALPQTMPPEKAGYFEGYERARAQASERAPEYMLRPGAAEIRRAALESADAELKTAAQRQRWVKGFVRGFNVGWAEGLEKREEARARAALWQ